MLESDKANLIERGLAETKEEGASAGGGGVEAVMLQAKDLGQS